jgi:MFS family permease
VRAGWHLGLLRERQFGLLWAGQTASAFGSALVPVALAFAVVDVRGTPSALGLVLTAGFVSRIALLLVGGVVADRLPRQHVMLAADVLRSVAQAVVAALLLAGGAQLWMLAVTYAIYGAGDAFFSPAAAGLVPDVVAPDRLRHANALIGLPPSAAAAIGPALAGVLVATAGPGPAFAIDAATFAVSAAALAFVRPRRGPPRAPGGIAGDIRGGWRELKARSWVWASILYFSVSNLAIAPLFVLGPFVAETALGGAAAWGLIVTFGGIGSLVGGAAALRLRRRRSLASGFLLLATWGLEPALLARPFPTAVIAAAAAIGCGALSYSNALWSTALQEGVPRASLARVSSFDWLGSRIFQPAGYSLAGAAAGTIGISATLLAGAVGHVSASLAIALVPSVRRDRPGPNRR